MLGELVCGAASVSGSSQVADLTLDHLKGTIDRFAGRSLGFLNGTFDQDAQNFGAFCARVVLENSCAALVGRLDPFRLLYLAQFQTQQSFEYGKPTNSGFRWTGDVLPDDKVPPDLWGADHNLSKVSRALLSPYAEHVYWRTAIENTIDFVASDTSEALQDIRALDPNTYVSYLRGRSSALYSTLSKGVHWDFFASSVVLDEVTIKDATRETLLLLGGAALLSHFVPTCYRVLDPTVALDAYKTLRGSFE